MFTIPTFGQAKKLVKKVEAFITKTNTINGHKVSQFDYLLAKPSDFKATEYAKELRGIAYVHKWLGLIKEPFPMLHKFHNLNECDGYMADQLKGYVPVSVQDKEDGSVISFIKIGDEWIAKSRYSFESFQAKKAQELLTPTMEDFLDFLYEGGMYPIFELVGKENPIVVRYDDMELRLLQIRFKNGNYVSQAYFNRIAPAFGIKTAKFHDISKFDNMEDLLNHYVELAETLEGKEGWIITAYDSKSDDVKMIKLKTKWYVELHRFLTGTALFANNIISYVLNGDLDDILSQMQLEEDDHYKKFIDDVLAKTTHFYNESYKRITKIVEDDSDMDKKEFVMKHKSDKLFHIIVGAKNGRDLEKLLKEHMLFKTRRKEMADKFLETGEL